MDVLVRRCESGIPVRVPALRNYIRNVSNNLKYMLNPGINVQYIHKCAKLAAKSGILPLTWEVVYDLLVPGVRHDVSLVLHRLELANSVRLRGQAFAAAMHHLGTVLGNSEEISLFYLPVAPNQLMTFLRMVRFWV